VSRAQPRTPADERGYTIVEVVIGALILALVIGAAATVFVSGNDTGLAAQRQGLAISVADQQIETIREEVKASGFNRLALSGAPQSLPAGFSTTNYNPSLPEDPNTFVSSATGCGSSNEQFLVQANYDNTAEGQPHNPNPGYAGGPAVTPWANCADTSTQVGEPLEVLSGYGFVTPQQTVSVGSGETAIVDSYVTDTYVGCNSVGWGGCPTINGSGAVACSSWPTSAGGTACGDARRVVVAVLLQNHGRFDIGPGGPLYVSTVFTNPVPSNEPSSAVGFDLGVHVG
jgi:type II secretory pathway pseudopilin PulG